MDITYLGQASFKIKTKTGSLVTDPYDSKILGLKFPATEADIVTISHNHADHNAVENVANTKKVISGPGEYEINGISVIGIQTYHDDKKGAERGKNTIYIIEAEGFRLLHLGDLGHKLEDHEIKEIGVIDVLFIPVGGYYTIDAKQGVEVYKQVGASIIVPMHYAVAGLNDEIAQNLLPVDDFLKESGLRVENLPKLSLKEGDKLSDEEYAVVLEKK